MPARTSSDERPPKLRRGTPVEYERTEEEVSEAEPECIWSEVEVSAEGTTTAHYARPPDYDPFIESVRQEAFKFSDTLPNYICDQKVVRYQGTLSLRKAGNYLRRVRKSWRRCCPDLVQIQD